MREFPIQRKKLVQNMVLAFALIVAPALVVTQSASAQTFTVLYTFTGGADGGNPLAGLVHDAAGNLYGTTSSGGSSLWCPNGCGTVFKIDTTGKETVLHSFAGSKDGAYPYYGALFRDGAGNLHGTTYEGGASGNGTVFRVTPTGKEAVLAFTGGTNGGFPYGGLIADTAGNLYGTTSARGSGCPPYGCGTVFKVDKMGNETVLYSFTGMPDGANPQAGLVRDAAGNLYGTTIAGGSSPCSYNESTGCGTVFKVDTTGKDTVLHSFASVDGAFPTGGLVRDAAGNLYGTTQSGGTSQGGTVFKVDTGGRLTTLYNFTSGADGGFPYSGLVRDPAGNLYGTTLLGGFGLGTVYKVDTTGRETVLYNFTDGPDGALPYGGLVRDSAGNLYGTTGGFFPNFGSVFKIAP
jgi:uncharacterized repeat protein (TIGR03803 family)